MRLYSLREALPRAPSAVGHKSPLPLAPRHNDSSHRGDSCQSPSRSRSRHEPLLRLRQQSPTQSNPQLAAGHRPSAQQTPAPTVEKVSSCFYSTGVPPALPLPTTPTASRTSRPPERTTANRPPHTSTKQFDPPPCQRRIPKLSSGHTRCPSQTQIHSGRPCRIPESQSTPSACKDGRGLTRASRSRRR